MSMKPIIFSEQEQLELRDLENSGNDFVEYKAVILRANFSGQDSMRIVQLVNFLDSVVTNVKNKIETIKQQAHLRANPPAAVVEPINTEAPLKAASNG